ncbi:MAG: MBL fold metallo-hydrolase [Trueperaceae bacterium]
MQEEPVGTLHLLGTGAALSGKERTTTMLALEGRDALVVIDCGGDAAQRMLVSGLDLNRVTALVVTHEHADHVAGFPLLMERLWLAGRTRPLDVFGIAPALAQAKRVHDAFDTATWPAYPEIRYHEVAHVEDAPVIADDDFEIRATPGEHAVPVVGLRVRDVRGGGVLAYSCDTERCAAITRMARGADLLVHEATGAWHGHSSALDAAEVAQAAGAERLVMVHIPPVADDGDAMLLEARERFSRSELGFDGAVHAF